MRKIAVVVCLLSLAFAACGKNDNPSVDATAKATNITVTASDSSGVYHFSHDASAVVDGLANITIKNQGTEPHEAVLFKLGDGKTIDDAKAFFAGTAPPGPPPFNNGGGTTVVMPGKSATVTQSVPAGSYAFFCFVAGAKGPHFLNGMASPITITGNSTTSLPLPDGENATAKDYEYALPVLKAGTTVIRATNLGPQDHEFQLARIADGKTAADAQAFFAAGNEAAPRPFVEQGGGVVGFGGPPNSFKVTLTKGTYVFYCGVPDQKDQKPHYAHGMFKVVTIT